MKFFKVFLWRGAFASTIRAAPSLTAPVRKSKKILREPIANGQCKLLFSLMLKRKFNKQSEWHFLS